MCGALLLPGLLLAHGDEDHGATAAAAVASTAQALRMEAASELFELVAALDGGNLVIHLDRFTSNEPVTGAKISVEGGPLKTKRTRRARRTGCFRYFFSAVLASSAFHLDCVRSEGGERER